MSQVVIIPDYDYLRLVSDIAEKEGIAGTKGIKVGDYYDEGARIMANQFGFMMKEEFLQAYADYVKQLREQNPGKRYAVMLSLDLIPDGVGYELSSPQLTVNEVTEDGKSTIVEMTGPSQITINEVQEEVYLRDLRPGAVFVTREGIYAVKSEYYYTGDSESQCECVLLASGEYAHFRDGNETLVREVSVEGL
jgi:hypothetical protein